MSVRWERQVLGLALLVATAGAAESREECLHRCTVELVTCVRQNGASSGPQCKMFRKQCIDRCSGSASTNTPAPAAPQPQPVQQPPPASAPASPPSWYTTPPPAPVRPLPVNLTELAPYLEQVTFVEEGAGLRLDDERARQAESWNAKDAERAPKLRQKAVAEMSRLLGQVCGQPAGAATTCERRGEPQPLPPLPPASGTPEPRQKSPGASAATAHACEQKGSAMGKECEQRCRAALPGTSPESIACERQCEARRGRFIDCCGDGRLGHDASTCFF